MLVATLLFVFHKVVCVKHIRLSAGAAAKWRVRFAEAALKASEVAAECANDEKTAQEIQARAAPLEAAARAYSQQGNHSAAEQASREAAALHQAAEGLLSKAAVSRETSTHLEKVWASQVSYYATGCFLYTLLLCRILILPCTSDVYFSPQSRTLLVLVVRHLPGECIVNWVGTSSFYQI